MVVPREKQLHVSLQMGGRAGLRGGGGSGGLNPQALGFATAALTP